MTTFEERFVQEAAVPAKTSLEDISFDPELTPGARNAVNVCLRVQPNERVTIITDEATKEIAASMAQELDQAGAAYRVWILEETAARPLSGLPAPIAEDLELSQVSIFAVQAQANELRSRMEMTDIVNRRKIRHAHMVNINRQIMLDGMRADFHKVDRISTRVIEMVRRAQQVRAKTAQGTDLKAELNKDYKWIKTSGLISPEKWGNLPGGEIFTTPGEVNGTFVVDGVVGDWLCAKFGDLRESPLTIQIKGNRLTEAHSANKPLVTAGAVASAPRRIIQRPAVRKVLRRQRKPNSSMSMPAAGTSSGSHCLNGICANTTRVIRRCRWRGGRRGGCSVRTI